MYVCVPIIYPSLQLRVNYSALRATARESRRSKHDHHCFRAIDPNLSPFHSPVGHELTSIMVRGPGSGRDTCVGQLVPEGSRWPLVTIRPPSPGWATYRVRTIFVRRVLLKKCCFFIFARGHFYWLAASLTLLQAYAVKNWLCTTFTPPIFRKTQSRSCHLRRRKVVQIFLPDENV